MSGEEFNNPWRTLSSVVKYDNPWIRLREDAVIRPDGQEGIYGVVHFKHVAVGVLAAEDDQIYLVGQYRYTLNLYSWEIPEGGCREDEDELAAAKRELEEETGLRARTWKKMGGAHLSNSVTDERAVWFLATGLEQGTHNPEGTERLQIRKVSLEQAGRMALGGEITDALSLLAVMQFLIKREEAGAISR